MTPFQPRGDEQRSVVETTERLTVVLGGAGTGKTTTALAAAAAHLGRSRPNSIDRVLFLSFSRASVASISSRSAGVLAPYGDRVDVMTFHALAYSIVRRFGSLIDKPGLVLVSPPRERLGAPPGSVGYKELIPMAIAILRSSQQVKNLMQSRWPLVIVDEFQDCGDAQQELLDELAPDARQILLGDPNQCIYTFLTADGVRLERISDASKAAGAANTIMLPDASHRDPTGVIPSVAKAIQARDFASPAIAMAITGGRLQVRSGIPLTDEVQEVSAVVKALRREGLGVAVFTHHNDMLVALSDGLENAGLEHEIAGLSDALACALDAQVALLRYGAGVSTWNEVLDSLAVFVTSSQRGSAVPQLATDILNGTGARTLQERLTTVRQSLDDASGIRDLLPIASGFHGTIGLSAKSNAWADASKLLAPMAARALRLLGQGASEVSIVNNLSVAAREATYSALTDVTFSPRPIQLMNLYQTKGREADATVVVLREGDFMGKESEPFPSTSRLLYVVFSRARARIVVLLVGSAFPPAVAPLATLAR